MYFIGDQIFVPDYMAGCRSHELLSYYLSILNG